MSIFGRERPALQPANAHGLGRKLLLAGIGLNGRATPDVRARNTPTASGKPLGDTAATWRPSSGTMSKYSPSTGASGPAAPCGVLATTARASHAGQHGGGQRLDQRFVSHVHTKLAQRRTLNIHRHGTEHARSTGTTVDGDARERRLKRGRAHTMSLGH